MVIAAKRKEYNDRYRAKFADEINERNRVWRKNNREYMREYSAQYRAENPAKRTQIKHKSYLANKHKSIAYVAHRRALKKKATPKWANKFLLSEAYQLAELRTKLTGVKHHVDHIVPLNSKLVCGLHCEFNVDVIPALDNRRKFNLYWPDMP